MREQVPGDRRAENLARFVKKLARCECGDLV
jgi:hypothetical protein